MSINWVMLSPSSSPPYTPLPNEQNLLTSSPRVALSLQPPANANKQQPAISFSASSGTVYLTNRRIIYLPDKASSNLQSFMAPLLSIHDSHVTAPWFGPNVWTALLQPTAGGGIPVPATGLVEIKFTFKEGGAFDFHTAYERVRERLQQVTENARANGNWPSGSQVSTNGVVDASVHLDQLPAYEEMSDAPLIAPLATQQHVESIPQSPVPHEPSARGNTFGGEDVPQTTEQRPTNESIPAEPPPGYEEAQLAGVSDELERQQRQQ